VSAQLRIYLLDRSVQVIPGVDDGRHDGALGVVEIYDEPTLFVQAVAVR
jgi:hypothetical protein